MQKNAQLFYRKFYGYSFFQPLKQKVAIMYICNQTIAKATNFISINYTFINNVLQTLLKMLKEKRVVIL
jgi:hypothetical protein